MSVKLIVSERDRRGIDRVVDAVLNRKGLGRWFPVSDLSDVLKSRQSWRRYARMMDEINHEYRFESNFARGYCLSRRVIVDKDGLTPMERKILTACERAHWLAEDRFDLGFTLEEILENLPADGPLVIDLRQLKREVIKLMARSAQFPFQSDCGRLLRYNRRVGYFFSKSAADPIPDRLEKDREAVYPAFQMAFIHSWPVTWRKGSALEVHAVTARHVMQELRGVEITEKRVKAALDSFMARPVDLGPPDPEFDDDPNFQPFSTRVITNGKYYRLTDKRLNQMAAEYYEEKLRPRLLRRKNVEKT